MTPATALSLEPAKDFELKDISGTTHRLSELRGKVVLLNFWATWCNKCVKENPSLERLYTELKDGNFTVLGISIDRSESALKKYLLQHPLSFPVLLDSKGEVFVRLYTLRGIPVTLIIDKEGSIAERFIGEQDFDSQRFREIISSLDGKNVRGMK